MVRQVVRQRNHSVMDTYIGNINMMVHVHGIEGGKKRGIRYDCDIILHTLHVNVPHKSQYN